MYGRDSMGGFLTGNRPRLHSRLSFSFFNTFYTAELIAPDLLGSLKGQCCEIFYPFCKNLVIDFADTDGTFEGLLALILTDQSEKLKYISYRTNYNILK